MDEDQQVSVLLSLNLNGTTCEGILSSSWEDNSTTSTHNSPSDKSNGNDQQDQDETVDSLIQKDFEFVKKHAGNADPEVILSFLSSQSSNPNRLESVMCDLLNIPNAAELIKEFRSGILRVGDKRSFVDPNAVVEDSKKAKTKDSESYLQQMRDMFPDADGLFLISECQQLESWEDFSRFVNTVMLSGVYPKKGAVEYSAKAESFGVADVINIGDYRTVESLSSEDEISSSGLTGRPQKKRRRRINRNSDSSNGSPREKVNGTLLSLPVVDVIDIASDTTEPYEPFDQNAALLEVSGERFQLNGETIEVEDVLPVGSPEVWEASLPDDGDGDIALQSVFERAPDLPPDTPTPGPSVFSARPRSRLSLPGKTSHSFDDAFGEKSLAEIIEDKRVYRRNSLAGTSTAKTNSIGLQSLLNKSLNDNGFEVSSPEVSTTTSRATMRRQASETDGALEESEDALKVSEEWLDEQTASLIRIFPNTDPSYLREEVVKMGGCSNAVNEFVIKKLERNDMPSRADYEKKLEMEELQNRYTKNFSIEDFLKAVPDPWAYFTQGNRNCAKYKTHSLCYLKSHFRGCYMRDIIDTFNRNNYNLYFSYHDLKKNKTKKRVSRRSEFECNQNRPTTIDIQFLQEVAFIENEEKIKDYLEGEKIARQIKFDEAKRTGSLLECQCCFDSEVLVEDISYCPKDHPFCKTCIVRSVEMEMAYGRFNFECLANCQEKFTLACLQNVLKPELFSKVIQAIQLEEIRAAEIEDLVQCPFCNYATIMPPEEKVMICLNPECLKESCRLCKELNHVPLRCDEVEKSEEVKMRTYIENKMTEALVRTCYKCGKKFVKEDGCNKMTCTCGAKMCYVCRRPVSDYSHFNGQGGTEYHKCPLYSTNDELHVDLVKRVGEEAKAEIMQANPHTKLLHDPTALAPPRTHQAPMPGVNNGVALDVAMRAIMGTLDEEDREGEEGQRQNRDRREIRREANPYYNRYHRHRHRALIESESEEDEEHRNRHRPQHNNQNHRHRHHDQVNDNRNHRYHHHHHRHHHHHHYFHQDLTP